MTQKHPIVLRCDPELFDWIARQAEAKRWSKPSFIIATLEAAKTKAEAKKKVVPPDEPV